VWGRLLEIGIDPQVLRVVLKDFVITQFYPENQRPSCGNIYPQSFESNGRNQITGQKTSGSLPDLLRKPQVLNVILK